MIDKRFYCDAALEYRGYGIFDLSKADKKREAFIDDDGDICGWMFHNYLVEETEAMLTGEQVEDLLNENNAYKQEIINVLKDYYTRLTRQMENSLTEPVQYKVLDIQRVLILDLAFKFGVDIECLQEDLKLMKATKD